EFHNLRFFPSLGLFLWGSFWRLRPASCSIISSTWLMERVAPILVNPKQARNLVVPTDWQITV
ncbi:hypothetical protein NDU88_002459, partial [Pleurodeles waltl]